MPRLSSSLFLFSDEIPVDGRTRFVLAHTKVSQCTKVEAGEFAVEMSIELITFSSSQINSFLTEDLSN
jgi:hypothetical protein